MYNYGNYISVTPDNTMLLKSLTEFIHDELGDSRYYELLAQKAPSERAKKMILEFSQDEKEHAMMFTKAYEMLSGRKPNVPPVKDPIIPPYEEALKQRIIAETSDYRKYGDYYLSVPYPQLKNMFFMARTGEAIHAMRLNMLLHDAK